MKSQNNKVLDTKILDKSLINPIVTLKSTIAWVTVYVMMAEF